jgi:hypothetical protein
MAPNPSSPGLADIAAVDGLIDKGGSRWPSHHQIRWHPF